MQDSLRPAVALATLFLLIAVAAPSLADTETLKAKRAFLTASSDSVVASVEEPGVLFSSGVELRGKGGCLLIRYSGELIGTDVTGNGFVAARFELSIVGEELGPVEVQPFPNLHQATTNILPQIVSFSAFACNLTPQHYNVGLSMRPAEEGDFVSTVFRTTEIWVEKGKIVPVIN